MNGNLRASLVLIALVATLVLSGCDSIGFGPKIAKCDDPDALKVTAKLIRSELRTFDALAELSVNLIADHSFTSTEMILNQGIDKEIGKSSCAASFVFTNPSKEPTTDTCKYVSRTEYELQYDTKGQLVSTIPKVGPLSCVKFTREEVAALITDPKRQTDLGNEYHEGVGVAQDYAEAMKWYRLAAAQGNANAQNNLGTMYYNGSGVAQDYAEAVKWYRKAAAQGNANAQNNLGAMYERGEGVPQDDAEAMKWYRLAAAQGNADAQFYLGLMYERGQGVAQDYAEAMKWYRKAAAQGNANGQFYLGLMYYYGRGVSKNIETARTWWQKAEKADRESVSATYSLGESYYAGEEFGATDNADRATTYWKKVINSTPSTNQNHKLASAGLQCIREGKSSKQCEPLRCSIEGRSDCPDL